jgi:hypothetical protein
MTTSETEVPKATSIVEPAQAQAQPQPQPQKNTTPDRVAGNRAEAVRAKKKKKRAAHRVALRRSHTGG